MSELFSLKDLFDARVHLGHKKGCRHRLVLIHGQESSQLQSLDQYFSLSNQIVTDYQRGAAVLTKCINNSDYTNHRSYKLLCLIYSVYQLNIVRQAAQFVQLSSLYHIAIAILISMAHVFFSPSHAALFSNCALQIQNV